MKRIIVVMALVSFGGACGRSSGAASPVALADWSTRLLEITCKDGVACGRYPDQASCRASNAADLGAIQAELAKGTIAYDGAAAAICLQALDDSGILGHCRASDKSTMVEPPSCFDVFVGTVAAGGACLIDEDCVGLQCDRGACTDACCAGACLPGSGLAVPVGGRCVASDHCVRAAFCSYDGAVGTCTARKAAGTSCGGGDECAVGLVCGPTSLTSAAKICRPAGLVGQACSAPCDPFGTYCDPQTLRCTPQHAVGQTCDKNGESCAFPAQCLGGATTGDPGTCAAPVIPIRDCAPPGYFCPRGLNCDAQCGANTPVCTAM